jgi:hypothetical protein
MFEMSLIPTTTPFQKSELQPMLSLHLIPLVCHEGSHPLIRHVAYTASLQMITLS